MQIKNADKAQILLFSSDILSVLICEKISEDQREKLKLSLKSGTLICLQLIM